MGWKDLFGFSGKKPGNAAPYVPPVTLRVFNSDVQRWPIVDELAGFFDRTAPVIRFYRDRWGRQRDIEIPVLTRSPLNEARMLESYLNSVLAEQMLRGIPITDAAGDLLTPNFAHGRALVEEIHNSDGSASYIVADGFGRSLNADEYDKADLASLNNTSGAWSAKPLALTLPRNKTPLGFLGVDDGIMPLFRMQLRQVVARSQRVDPLAPPSTEKGGARFAWPFSDDAGKS